MPESTEFVIESYNIDIEGNALGLNFSIHRNNANENIKALIECIITQYKKSQDYQNSKSNVTQADYYPRGLDSLYDIMNAKMLRIKSLLDTCRDNPDLVPNFESLEDSAKDLANYSSFFVAWSRGKINGQDSKTRDLFNRKKSV